MNLTMWNLTKPLLTLNLAILLIQTVIMTHVVLRIEARKLEGGIGVGCMTENLFLEAKFNSSSV